MLDFEHMLLPAGTTVESVIKESSEAVARIGSNNARFSTVSVAGMTQVITNPDVELAWQQRKKEASTSAP